MNIFLTGGTGFIGSHFLKHALNSGHNVRALKRRENRRVSILLPQRPTWCIGDLNDISVEQLQGCDVLVHLACIGVSPKQAALNELVDTNISSAVKLFQRAVDSGIGRLVIAGSSHEYGLSALNYDFIPASAPLAPVNAYGASKAAAFQIFQFLGRDYGIELYYGRIFSAFGDGQSPSNFWPSLRQAALRGEDFLMTSGQQITDYISVQEVARHLLIACSRDDIAPGHPLIINVGSGRPQSLLSFAQEQWACLNASGKLIPGGLPDRPNQIVRCVPDLQGLNCF